MSLINQMLKDLEQRNAGAMDMQRPLSGEVRAVPLGRRGSPLKLIAVLLVGLLVGALYVRQQHASTMMPVVTEKPQVVTPKSVDIAPPAVPAPSETVQLDIVQPQSSPAPETTSMPLLERELRITPPEQVEQQVKSPEPQQPAKPKAEPLAKNEPDSKPKPVADTAKVKLAAKTSPDSSPMVKQVRPEQISGNYYRQALLYLQQGRVAESQAALVQALDANPANHDARLTLAGLLVDNKRKSEAMSLLAKGAELAPEQSGFSLALARLQLDAGDKSGALATLEQGLPYAKNDADYHGFLATLLQRADRHDEAINHYMIALAGDSMMPSWLIGLGISLQATNRLAEAQEAFQRAQNANLSPDLAQFVDQRLKQIRQRLR
jgi:MSHA biogenesis protein MshN